ncbi:hypothetical protein FQN54_000635 [Arachnomyces sp. PD_36]|nr:hypothetical protein FQN54_000635 [Arachnomyces sp. PD_36]
MDPSDSPQINNAPGDSQEVTQDFKGVDTFAIVNCSTGKQLSIADGCVVTTPNASVDNQDNHRVVEDPTSSGEADKALHAIVDVSSGESIDPSNGNLVSLKSDDANEPTPRWTSIPKEDHAGVFYIADAQTQMCLKDSGPGTETAAISTDVIPSGAPEQDSTRLWRLFAISGTASAKKDNLTSVDNTIPFARPAMELLLKQWEDGKIVHNPTSKPVHTMASIDKNDIATLKKDGNKLKAKDEGALLNGGVRIDRQGFFQETPKKKDSPYFANMQGQVSTWSVWQVNVQTGHNFGARTISNAMTKSMEDTKEEWLRK